MQNHPYADRARLVRALFSPIFRPPPSTHTHTHTVTHMHAHTHINDHFQVTVG